MKKRIILPALLCTLLQLTLPGGAQAAPLNLVEGQPDIAAAVTGTGGSATSKFLYDYTAGVGGTLTLVDTGGFGTLLNRGSMFYSDWSAGLVNDAFVGDYSLTATFSALGVFTGGTIAITITGDEDATLGENVDTIPGVATAPPTTTILSGTLFNFGFSGTGNAGVLEFEAAITGGVWGTMGYSWSGTVASVTLCLDNACGTNNSNNSYIPVGSWDADPNLFLNDLRIGTTGNNINTFIPVPAAVWLFGSGLLGLAGFGARKRRPGGSP